MCGLVGILSSDFQQKHKDVLATMLFLDTFRGRDSTGVAALRNNADTVILKSTVPGYEFVEGPKLEQHLKLNDFLWIGHNRFGTVGKNIKTNAHPFEILDEDGSCLVVGAHNGTLKNKHVLTDHAQFGTDSEALFNEIATIGVEEAIGKVEGAWAITYYDHIEEELRVLRNKERPLFYAYEEGKKTLLWASEMWMLRVACSRHGVKLENDQVLVFNEDTLYRFPAPMKRNEELTCERKGGLVGKATPAFFRPTTETGGRDGFHRHHNHYTPRNPQQEAAETARKARENAAAAIAARLPQPLVQQGGLLLPATQPSSTASGTSPSEKAGDGETPPTTNVVSLNSLSNSEATAVTSSVLNYLQKVSKTAKIYKGYGGILLTADELKNKLDNGCGWCELEWLDLDDTYGWLSLNHPICNKCLKGIPEPDKEVTLPASAVTVH